MNINEVLNSVINNPGSGFLFTPPLYMNGSSYLFSDPYELITAGNQESLFSLLTRIEQLPTDRIAFGFLTYEAGYAFEKTLNKYLSGKEILAFFGFYNQEKVKKIKFNELKIDPASRNGFCISSFHLDVLFEEYKKAISKIKNYISEGDTYQVNYTTKGKFKFKGDPAALFLKLIFSQSAEYSAFINTGEKLIISISPEFFFKVKDGRITVKPMKGTSARGINLYDDKNHLLNLIDSKKDRAENLMIVDLLRNDLGKISRFGSVKLNSLFNIEKYETLFQMTSEIEGEIKEEIKFCDIIKNVFPSGSVTGAPKIRTMEIINELEKEKREVYTGSIGFVKGNEMQFNVAIRTVVIDQKERKGEVGLGSGIVWDSDPAKEYQELQIKSRFLTIPLEEFELIETMKLENRSIPFLAGHLKRLHEAADFFLFLFDEEKIKSLIESEIIKCSADGKYKLKLRLSKYGKIKIELTVFPITAGDIKVIISDKRINSGDSFRYFKTTNRKLYDEEYSFYSRKGFFDVLFLNEKNQVAEGSVTNIFVKMNNIWYTPPVDAGILNGIFRAHLLEKDKNIIEKNLCTEDLINAEEIKLTNALRGEIKVNKLILNGERFIEF